MVSMDLALEVVLRILKYQAKGLYMVRAHIVEAVTGASFLYKTPCQYSSYFTKSMC